MNHSRSLLSGWISRSATLAFAVVIGVALASQDAEARLGGGKSFGRQSPNATRQASPPSRDAPGQSAQQPGQPPGGQPPMQPARNRWLGPIAGLAAGLGIAALLSHFGMGGGFGDGLGSVLVVVLLVLAAVFVWRMLRGSRGGASVGDRMQPAYGVADAGGAGAGTGPISAYTPVPASSMPGSVAALSTPTGPSGVPADFDVAGFLRNAKVYFIRLQAAWDEKNLADIREFTTPEVYAEIRMQLDEEKGAQNHTEAITLDAELLGIETTATDYLATARFTGTIRENNGAVGPLVEVWNFAKPKDGHTGWLLAGIQQVH